MWRSWSERCIPDDRRCQELRKTGKWPQFWAGLLVRQFRTPRLAAAVWRVIEEIPERPYHVHMARILSRLLGRKHKFGLVEMVYRAVAAHKYIQCRYLFPFGRFAVVITIVAIRSR